jgi:hypothetical protein
MEGSCIGGDVETPGDVIRELGVPAAVTAQKTHIIMQINEVPLFKYLTTARSL